MRRPFLNDRVATLSSPVLAVAVALLFTAACESPRESLPVDPDRDAGGGGGETGLIRGGAPAGSTDSGSDMEPDAPVPHDAQPDAASPDAAPTGGNGPLPPGGCIPGSRRCVTMDIAEVCPAGTWQLLVCPGGSNTTPICRSGNCDYECLDSKFPHRCAAGCCECERDGDCAVMADSAASCTSGRCAYTAMCDLGRRTWTMNSVSPCPSSIWAFTPRDGRWAARETGCGNATGFASYDGTVIRLDFTYDIGAGRYTWPVDGHCAGSRGTLVFTAGPNAGEVYDSTLTAN